MPKPGMDPFQSGLGPVRAQSGSIPAGDDLLPESPPRLPPVPGQDRRGPGSPIIAPFADRPLRLDGRLQAPVWQEVPPYELTLPQDLSATGRRLEEPGQVQFVWDARFLYLGVDLEDSDLVAEGEADGQMHNTLGDCCELLIKPEAETWYWEFHVTPAGRTSAFFFPGRGRLCLPSCVEHRSGVRVAVHCRGTLNDWRDRDQGWSAEMAVPVAELTGPGGRFEPGARWRVLVGRYNYSRYLSSRGPELTTMPHISRADFHRHEEYALLSLRP